MKYLTNAITVVIPLFNKKSHIVETVKAVLAQTYPPFEIIVVNDGSTDGGELALAECNFPNVQIINKCNEGVSVARNTGIAASRTELVALLDADDQWRPHFLEEIYSLSHEFPEAGIYSTAYQYKKGEDSFSNPRLSAKHCPTHPALLTHFFAMMANGDLPLTMSSIAIRRTLFDNIGGFPAGETMGEDQDFLFRAALAKPIAYSPKVLALYILNSDNRACVAHLPQEECAFSKRISTIAELPHLSQDIKLQLNKCSAAHLLHLAKRNIQAGRLENVKGFLDDPRCALKPTHRTYWYARYLLGATCQYGAQRLLNWTWTLTKPEEESLRQ